MIGQNKYVELITVNKKLDVDGNVASNDPLILQRYLIDRTQYSELTVKSCLYARRANPALYHTFIYQNDTLENVAKDLDVLACFLNGPTVVGVGTEVKDQLEKVLQAINRSPILPQRV